MSVINELRKLLHENNVHLRSRRMGNFHYINTSSYIIYMGNMTPLISIVRGID